MEIEYGADAAFLTLCMGEPNAAFSCLLLRNRAEKALLQVILTDAAIRYN